MGKMSVLNISLNNILNDFLLAADKICTKNNDLFIQKFFDSLIAKNVEIDATTGLKNIVPNEGLKEQLKKNLQYALETYFM